MNLGLDRGSFLAGLGVGLVCGLVLVVTTGYLLTYQGVAVSTDAERKWVELGANIWVCEGPDQEILGIASIRWPNFYPGQWFAFNGNNAGYGGGSVMALGSYVSLAGAKYRVEQEIGGCPGMSSLRTMLLEEAARQ